MGLFFPNSLWADEFLAIPPAAVRDPSESQPSSTKKSSFESERVKKFNLLPESLPNVSPLIIPYHLAKAATFPIMLAGHAINKNRYSRKTVQFISNSSHSFSLFPLLTVGDGKRFGGGMGVTHLNLFNKDYKMDAQAIVFTDLDVRAQFLLGTRHLTHIQGHAVSFLFGANLFMDSDEFYYGLGPNTSDSNKGEFSDRNLRTGVAMGFEIFPHFNITPHVAFDWNHSGFKNLGGTPSVQTIFPASELAGFGETISYLDLGLSLPYDSRDTLLNTQKGGLYSFSFHHYWTLQNTNFSYYQWSFNFEHYFPLGVPRLVLWLHNKWAFEEKTKNNQIPFYRQSALDLYAPLRGFNRGRFRDQDSTVFNVELRYPLWDIVDGTAFVDTGRVFDGIKSFSFNDFKYSVGGGFRIIVNEHYLFKLEVATGGEGPNVIFKAYQQL